MADIAVVTGAGSGIGRAIAVALADRGNAVIAADVDLTAAQDTATRHADAITALAVDVTDRCSVEALAAQVARLDGSVRVLVNAAGWDRANAFLDSDEDFANRIVSINYLGPVRVCSVFLPAMVDARRGGHVVNIASDAGRVGSMGESIYSGAKGGVIALTKSLAREMARHSITVNCVCPGPTDTPLFAALPENLRTALIRAIPFRRLAQPDEVASAALFFASDDASYVTGQVLSVSGGLTMAG